MLNKTTKIKDINNVVTIAENTKKAVDNILETFTIEDFTETNKDNGEITLKSTTLGILCGEGSSAIANAVKKYKGDMCEKLAQFFENWQKKGNNKQNATELKQEGANNEKKETIKRMMAQNLPASTISLATGLDETAITEIEPSFKEYAKKHAK